MPGSDESKVNNKGRSAKTRTCTCICCSRTDGTTENDAVIVPRLATNNDAPSRTENWVLRFDHAIAELAQVASEYKEIHDRSCV